MVGSHPSLAEIQVVGNGCILHASPSLCRCLTRYPRDLCWRASRLNTEGDYFSMTGTLLDPSTGCLPALAADPTFTTVPLATPSQAGRTNPGPVFTSLTPKDRAHQDVPTVAAVGCAELRNHGSGGSNPGAPGVSGRPFEPSPGNPMGSSRSGHAQDAGVLDQGKRRRGEEDGTGAGKVKRKKQKLKAGPKSEVSSLGAVGEDGSGGAGQSRTNKRSDGNSGAEGRFQNASADQANHSDRMAPLSSEIAAFDVPELLERDRKGHASPASDARGARPSPLESGGWQVAATQSAKWDSAHRKHKKKRTHDAGFVLGVGSELLAKGAGQKPDAGLLGELNHRQGGKEKRKSKGVLKEM